MGSQALDMYWGDPVAAPAPPHMEANRWISPVVRTKTTRRRAPIKPEPLEFLGCKIDWTPDANGKFPEPVFQALTKLIEFSCLEENWDSYGGSRMSSSAVASVLELVFAGHQRGTVPRLHPLSGGGVGVDWEMGTKELSVQVSRDGTVEALYSNDSLGEEIELEAGSTVDLALDLVGKLIEHR